MAQNEEIILELYYTLFQLSTLKRVSSEPKVTKYLGRKTETDRERALLWRKHFCACKESPLRNDRAASQPASQPASFRLSTFRTTLCNTGKLR